MPEKLLKSQSEFFTAALEGGFAEGISKSVTLPEEDPNIFGYFVEWLFVGHDQSAAFESDFLVRLWTLGDRLACPMMQDEAMCNLIDIYSDGHIDVDTLKQIYELSAPGSKIRGFVIDQCLFDIRGNCLGRHHKEWSYLQFAKENADFAQQLAEETILLSNRKPNEPYRHRSPYLFGPLSCPSTPSSGS